LALSFANSCWVLLTQVGDKDLESIKGGTLLSFTAISNSRKRTVLGLLMEMEMEEGRGIAGADAVFGIFCSKSRRPLLMRPGEPS
jgi:hypothetical protein